MTTEDSTISPILFCFHPMEAERHRICAHLAADDTLGYYQKFTGQGSTYDLVCTECGQIPAEGSIPLQEICQRCFTNLEEELSIFSCLGMIGHPTILERACDLFFSHEMVAVDQPIEERILAFQPISDSSTPQCIALTESGKFYHVDLAARLVVFLAQFLDAQINLTEKVSLHLSQDGNIAAVVNTFGQYGVVVDLTSGKTTMRLERGDYCTNVSRFPLSFISVNGQILLIHATDWNRLDVSEPRTGDILTQREPTSYETGQKQPEHYLDYFHAGLLTSPAGDWVADNGWIWHPVGAVRTWSLRKWMEENVWESEDGSSLRTLCWRSYFWGQPICWLDDLTLAVWGFGQDDDFIIPAVRIFDVTTGEQIRWFAGPKGELVFSDYLFALSQEQGTTVWDVKTGERLHSEPEMKPDCYHPGAKTFISLLTDGKFQISRLEEGAQ